MLGVKVVKFDFDDDLARFYQSGILNIDLVNNQYVIITDKNDDYIGRYRWDDKNKRLINFNCKTIDNSYVKKLKPRNFRQQCAFNLLQDDNIPVKLITGVQGSGKTFLTLHHALDKVENSKNFKKIVYIRNNIDVKDTNNIGALPSGLKEKLLPYIMPIADCIGNMVGLQMLENQEKIEYVHLGFVRGRNFSDSIIIVSESQSLTKEHVALLLGRVGENSIIIFEGDLSQIDKKVFEDNSGIKALEQILFGNELFGWVHLDKTERSRVANLSSLFM